MMTGGRSFAATSETMLPDLLERYPQARRVLDRYGLRGCGGRLGPHESLHFFARAHGVDEALLLAELQQAMVPSAEPRRFIEAADAADTIYRRFFIAGIVVVLTAGASWGAYLLWKIGLAGKFTGVSILAVNAHGHAQIFGWVGLFVMGFSLQAFPRFWHTRLAVPRLAAVTFAVMLLGIVIRTAGMAGGAAEWAIPAAMAGGALEIAAILIFVAQLVVTFRRSGAALEPYIGFVLVGMFWFIVQAVMSVWHTWATMTAASPGQLLWYVSTYQAPLRDLQVHGLALFMILGVSMRMLPALLGLPEIGPRRGWIALAMVTAAVVGECLVFVVYRWTQLHAVAALLMIPWLLLVAGIGLVVLPWKLWRPLPTAEARADRIGKFVRAAYAWLAASLLMLLMLPVYQWVSGIPFSHAYYGAIRHAITVGFISLMIMGMAAKIVPTLNGVDPRGLSRLWGPFVLVNLGCFLRVTMQTLTDGYPMFFHLVGISGVLEVAGLAWWGVGLVGIMRRGRRESRVAGEKPDSIRGGHRVGDVLEWFPATLGVFVQNGFTPLQNPTLRATLARGVTLRTAANLCRVPLNRLLAELNDAVGIPGDNPAPAGRSAPSNLRG